MKKSDLDKHIKRESKDKDFKILFDKAEEKRILGLVEKGEWKSVRGAKGKIKKYQEYAKETFRKDKRVNIRISEKKS